MQPLQPKVTATLPPYGSGCVRGLVACFPKKPEITLTTLYAITLVGVCIVMFGMLLDAVMSVSRKPVWGQRRQALALIHVADRRTQQLPFVGTQRRAAEVVVVEDQRKLA